MQKVETLRRVTIAFVAVSGLSACVGTADLKKSANFDSSFATGQFESAYSTVAASDNDHENLLSLLQAAEASRASGEYETAVDLYDAAEEQLMWKADRVDTPEEVARLTGTFLTNDLAAKYVGNIYEGTLVNTFAAQSYMMLGDEDRARVQLNRADERQDVAMRQLESKISAAQSKNRPDAKEQQYSGSISKSGAKLSSNAAYNARLKTLESFKGYEDERNPYTDYLHGIFRLTTGDLNRASDLLLRADALVNEKNDYVKADAILADRWASDFEGHSEERRVWVIMEDGLGPKLEEFRIDLPVFLVSSSVLYSGIALPTFETRSSAFNSIGIVADDVTHYSQMLLSVDNMAAAEFKATYDGVVAKSVASAIVKTIAQAAINKSVEDNVGGWGGLLIQVATAAAQAASTKADTRFWTALPKSVYVASFPYPESGEIVLQIPGWEEQVILPDTRFALVHVKAITGAVKPVVSVASLGEGPLPVKEDASPFEGTIEVDASHSQPSAEENANADNAYNVDDTDRIVDAYNVDDTDRIVDDVDVVSDVEARDDTNRTQDTEIQEYEEAVEMQTEDSEQEETVASNPFGEIEVLKNIKIETKNLRPNSGKRR